MLNIDTRTADKKRPIPLFVEQSHFEQFTPTQINLYNKQKALKPNWIKFFVFLNYFLLRILFRWKLYTRYTDLQLGNLSDNEKISTKLMDRAKN